MSPRKYFFMLCAMAISAVAAHASPTVLSYTGALANPQSVFTLTFSVGGTGSQTIDLQTWGFGGGTNANGQAIPAGGFDPLLALFSSSGPAASLINGTSDVLSNFGSFVGCGPAGTVAFGNGDSVCGDISISFTLAPGEYTLILSDADYVPNALSDNGTLGEGFTDFTGGAFQTCDTNASGSMSCITPTNNWAFDITNEGSGSLQATPEPVSLLLLGTGLLGVGWWGRRKFVLKS